MSPTPHPPSTQYIDTRGPSAPGFFKRALHVPGIVLGAGIIVVVALLAFVLPLVLGLNPLAVDPMNRLAGPSSEHLLGTDTFGRDLLARILAGAQTSLFVGFVVALVSGVIGTVIGVLAAFNTVLDSILMRICDGLMAIPAILLAVALAAALGPSITNLILALTVVYTPYLARLVRSRALAVKSETFVEASIGAGAKPHQVMLRHILPNSLSVIVVQSTFTFAESVIVEAALSFLGAGVPAPAPSWGNILYDGKSVIATAPSMIIFTSCLLIITVLALNIFGDGLRDLVDQRGRPQKSRFRITGFSRLSIGNARKEAAK